tara:strand:+ start:86 stop:496 length:411 start_codon:yes stop_codon:yes gene_type:complete
MKDSPDTIILSGTPSAESGDSQEFNPYAGSGAYQQPMIPVLQTNDSATYSMWLGIATWFCWISSPILCFTGCLTPFTTIAGIMLGHMGFNTSKEMNGMGRNEAIAGLVMNYLSLAVYVGSVLFGVAILGFGFSELA